MQIEVQIKEGCREPRVVIYTERMTEEVQALLTRLEAGQEKPLIGFSEGTATVLQPETLLRVYLEGGRVFAHTEQGTFALRAPSTNGSSGWTRALSSGSPSRRSSTSTR